MNLIFDFDGTIADTFNIYVQVMREIHEVYKFKYISDDSIESYREMTGQEVLKNLGISMIHLPMVAHRVRKDFRKLIPEQTIFPKWLSVLEQLKNDGHRLFILSSNSEENIRAFLHRNRANYFDCIISGSSIFGKAHVIKKLLKTKDIDPKHAYYIGDETRDIEAARKAGIKIISVSWGYNNRKILESMVPDYIIDHPQNIFQIIAQ